MWPAGKQPPDDHGAGQSFPSRAELKRGVETYRREKPLPVVKIRLVCVVVDDARSHLAAVVGAQDSEHGYSHDYVKGSPHLRHSALRVMVESQLDSLVRHQLAATERCRALEVGGGHGTFTATLVAAGAEVTVTETSSASARLLAERFGPQIRAIHDQSGKDILMSTDRYDLVALSSVLHHIPDYLSFIDGLCQLVDTGGSFFTVADPLYYPRMSAWTHRADRLAYLTWRLFQGNYARGVATRLRRARGVYSDTESSDLVEYHVVRDGVDEVAVRDLLSSHFRDVETFSYWASQAPVLQWIGSKTPMVTDFGVVARLRDPTLVTSRSDFRPFARVATRSDARSLGPVRRWGRAVRARTLDTVQPYSFSIS